MRTIARAGGNVAKRAAHCVCLALGLAATTIIPAHASEPGVQEAAPSSEARYLSGNCTTCHGFDGRPAGDTMPRLAGQPAARLVEQFRAYRDGTREGTIMNQIAKGYTDTEIEALARYFSGQEASK